MTSIHYTPEETCKRQESDWQPMLLLSSVGISNPAFAGNSIQTVEGSYIVTFTPAKTDVPSLILPVNKANQVKAPFGEHSTGQSKKELAATLGTTGEVVSIFETINAAHIKMAAKEAERLSRDKRVLRVDQSVLGTLPTAQSNPGWALDRLDSATPALDNTYNYVNTGAGRTIYLLDSGLALSNATVAAEFGGRASIIWDHNPGGTGDDCVGHGTEVASLAGGSTYGVAKGVTLIEAKVTNICTTDVDTNSVVASLNWLAANAPHGTIVIPEMYFNFSGNCGASYHYQPLDDAVTAAHDAGIVVVVPAGNDACNTANYSPVSISQSFVVGATNTQGLPYAQDRKSSFSRTGTNISSFAPGEDYVRAMTQYGWPIGVTGTSFSAPLIAGIFAVVCQAAGTYCNTTNTATLYQDLRNLGTIGTVTNTDGTPLTGATSRFIRQQW